MAWREQGVRGSRSVREGIEKLPVFENLKKNQGPTPSRAVGIRTLGLHDPNVALYQAELRPGTVKS